MTSNADTQKQILAGTDFSRPGTRAVTRAAMLAAQHSARLEIVYVMPRLDRAVLRLLGRGSATAREIEEVSAQHLNEAVELAEARGVSASARILRGSAAAEMAREAERIAADLIVIGNRGQRARRPIVIGTTAERLVERGGCDILVVRTQPKAPYHTILTCVALGPKSHSVLSSAAALSDNAEFHLVHAYEPPFESQLLSQRVGEQSLREHRAATRARALADIAALVERSGVAAERHPTVHVRRGEPSDVILTTAEQVDANLVVVGRNQSALEAFFLGSATKHVLRAASIDVLISVAR